MPLLSVTLISFLDSTFTCATSCRMALSSHSAMWGTAFSSIPAASLMRRSASVCSLLSARMEARSSFSAVCSSSISLN